MFPDKTFVARHIPDHAGLPAIRRVPACDCRCHPHPETSIRLIDVRKEVARQDFELKNIGKCEQILCTKILNRSLSDVWPEYRKNSTGLTDLGHKSEPKASYLAQAGAR